MKCDCQINLDLCLDLNIAGFTYWQNNPTTLPLWRLRQALEMQTLAILFYTAHTMAIKFGRNIYKI